MNLLSLITANVGEVPDGAGVSIDWLSEIRLAPPAS
jgi:hypothetical protein